MTSPTLTVLLVDASGEPSANRARLASALPHAAISSVVSNDGLRESLSHGCPGIIVVSSTVDWASPLDVVETITTLAPECPAVLLVSADGRAVETLTAAMRAGYADCVVDNDELPRRLAASIRAARSDATTRAARRVAESRSAFLADLMSALTSSLDVDDLVAHLARAAVPALADLAVVHIVDDNGDVHARGVAHRDPEIEAVVHELNRDYPTHGNTTVGLGLVLTAGRSVFVPELTTARVGRVAKTPRHGELLEQLGLTSVIIVPLSARGRVLGAFTTARTTPGRRYAQHDLAFVEDVARRAALALDNARLYRESTRARGEIARLTQDLQRRLKELDTLLQVIPIGIGIADDPECRHIRVNQAAAKYLGVTSGQNASMSAPDGDRPPFRCMRDGLEIPANELPMQLAASKGITIREIELDVVRADGQRKTLFEYAAPLLDEDGHLRGSVGAMVDITERKRAEERAEFLNRASMALATSLDVDAMLNELVHLVVPAMGDWCVVDLVEPEGGGVRRRAASHADVRLARRARELPTVFPFGLGHRMNLPTWPLRGGREATVVLAEEMRLFDHLPVELSEQLRTLGADAFVVAPLASKGRPLGVLTVVSATAGRYEREDVSLVEELAFRFGLALDNAWLYDEARTANRLKDEFLATVSHELRTPLNAMLGWIRLLRTGALGPDMTARALEIIERNTVAQTVLINDLLDVSRVVSGKLHLALAEVDLAAVVQAAVDAVRPAADARGVSIETALEATASIVRGDADRLRQVVWNLLSNAVKFTSDGGQVDVSLTELAGQRIQVSVRDTGIGISSEFLPFVFERFRQADSSTTRHHGGLGLGLAIVRHLVELHGGNVRAESAGRGRGATFMVDLPLPPASSIRGDRPVAGTTALVPHPPWPALVGRRILAVDDDAETRELLKTMFARAGAWIETASDAREALSRLKAGPVDLLLADLGLPGEDGLSLIRSVRALAPEAGGDVPAIALTAYARGEDARESLAAGFDRHLAKPVDPDHLCEIVAGVLEARTLRVT